MFLKSLESIEEEEEEDRDFSDEYSEEEEEESVSGDEEEHRRRFRPTQFVNEFGDLQEDESDRFG